MSLWRVAGCGCVRRPRTMFPPSSALAAGYREEGALRSAGFTHSGRVDLVIFGKTRADL